MSEVVQKGKHLGQNPVAQACMLVFFIILAVVILIPLYALLLGTFKGGAELFVSGLNLSLQPEKLHLKAWTYLFTGVMSDGTYNPHDDFIWYKNSIFIVLVQGGLTLLISAMVAYGFSKYRFKGQNALFMCVLLVMMIPLEILMLPLYTQINAMGLRNSYAGVMLPFLANMSAIFFFRQFLEGVPHDLLDAGRVDGCTEYGIFFCIIMPIMKPAYAAGGHGRVERPPVAHAGAFRHEEIHHSHRPQYALDAIRQQLRPDDHRLLLRHPAASASVPVCAEIHH